MDIRELDLIWFREQLGVVSQEPVLFAGSVRDNIKLGAPNATDEEMEEAARLALVHDFVCKLPDVRHLQLPLELLCSISYYIPLRFLICLIMHFLMPNVVFWCILM